MTTAEKREEVRALAEKAEQLDDPRSAVKLIRERMDELSNRGIDIPEEFTRIEKRYLNECIYSSQGR
jgi:hypothetical protein